MDGTQPLLVWTPKAHLAGGMGLAKSLRVARTAGLLLGHESPLRVVRNPQL